MNNKKTKGWALFSIALGILLLGFSWEESFLMPVEDAGVSSYHSDSFWFYPWGKSITHKGVDIFAKRGRTVFSSTNGIILYQGNIDMGGNVVLVLGPQWKLHYYAHLDKIETFSLSYVSKGAMIGTVGDSGNAAGKPTHLHYAIVTLFPYFWLADKGIEGWKKMFYLNPIPYLNKAGK
ncbi:M23 family metallopeptidase [Leptospira sanjuanensis]|uniref:M23 family metallopeptidase n=1 Tax=Leptospira sanjuanensis TaxID=2879643 RepID=UPI0038735F37